MKESYELSINGEPRIIAAEADTSLLLLLRNEFGLFGTRFGCGLSQCGACFVNVDGAVVASCDLPIAAVAGATVVTIEGLATGDALHPVQQAVLDQQAGQCGYCLSGMMVSAAALFELNPKPDEQQVAEALERNLCRCGVQRRFIAAVMSALQDQS